MDRAEIEAILVRSYAARKAGDVETTVGVFSEDAVYRRNGSAETLSTDTRLRGRPAIAAMLEHLIGAFEFVDYQIADMLIDGNKACVHLTVEVRYTATGQTVETELMHLWHFENGFCSSFVEFADTAMIGNLVKLGG